MVHPRAARSPDLRIVHAKAPEPQLPADLDEAFRRYAPVVAKVGLRILGRPHEVDDLVQDVFLDVRRWLNRLDSPDAFRGWLITVTVRAARHRLQRRRLGHFLGLRGSFDYGAVVDKNASASQRAFMADLYRVLDGLPVNQRLAWSLRYIEGESVGAVAELCRCSRSTAKRRIADAHRVLVEAFRD